MSIRLQVLVPEAFDSRMRKAAQRSRVSKSEWVRRAVERALDNPTALIDSVARLAPLGAPTADIDQMLAEIEARRS